MRRLVKYLAIFTLTLLFSAVLTLCSLENLSHKGEESRAAVQSCFSSCLTHAQTAVSNNIKSEDEENEKFTPANSSMPEIPISMSAPYVMAAAGLFFVRKRKLTLLTLQLRL